VIIVPDRVSIAFEDFGEVGGGLAALAFIRNEDFGHAETPFD
jgi:hypothetical protein